MASQGLTVNGVPIDQSMLDSLPESHRHRAGTLVHLGKMFYIRYEHSSEHLLSDLGRSIQCAKDAITLLADKDTGKNDIWHFIGTRAWQKFQRSGDLADIDEAIKAVHEAVSSTPEVDTAPRLQMLQALADHHCFKASKFEDLSDRFKAIEIYRRVAQEAYQKYNGLNRLWNNITASFRIVAMKEDFPDMIICAAEDILTAMNRFDKDELKTHMQALRGNLGRMLVTRSAKTQSLGDIQKALSLQLDLVCDPELIPEYRDPLQQDLILGHENLSAGAMNLLDSYRQSYDQNTLDEALSLATRSYEYFEHHSESDPKTVTAANLSDILYEKHALASYDADITKAFELSKFVLEQTSPLHPRRVLRVQRIGRCMAKLHKQTASLDGVQTLRIKIQTILKDSVSECISASQLQAEEASVLREFYEEYGYLEALDAAIGLYHDIISKRDNLEEAILRELAIAAIYRWRMKNRITDLMIAVSSAERAYLLTRDLDHPNYESLSIFGNTRADKFFALGDMNDLYESIHLLEEAINLAPADDRGILYVNLGNHLEQRFNALGAVEDFF